MQNSRLDELTSQRRVLSASNGGEAAGIRDQLAPESMSGACPALLLAGIGTQGLAVADGVRRNFLGPKVPQIQVPLAMSRAVCIKDLPGHSLHQGLILTSGC